MNREKWSERGSSVKSLFSSKLDASRKVSSNSFDKSLYQSGQKRQEPANIAFLHCHVTSYCTSILRKIGSLRVRTFSLIQSRLNRLGPRNKGRHVVPWPGKGRALGGAAAEVGGFGAQLEGAEQHLRCNE